MKIHKFRDYFVLAKYRFDTGITFLVFVNFSLLIITASDKIQTQWNISILRLGLILIPFAIIGTWLFGCFLDKIIKYQKIYLKEAHKRSPILMDTLNEVKKINERLDKLEKEYKK